MHEDSGDSVLYLVDASESMASSTALDSAVASIEASIREVARAGSTASFDTGLIFFNVADNDGVFTFQELGDLTIERLKTLHDHVKQIPSKVIKCGPSSGDSLLNALRLAKAALNKLVKKTHRRVVLITNMDDPFNCDENKELVAKTLFSDIVASPAEIAPIFVNQNLEAKFDVMKFWHDVEYSESYTPTFLQPVEPKALNSIHAALVHSRSVRKFEYMHGVLSLRNIEIGITAYSIERLPGSSIPPPIKVGVADKNGKEQLEVLQTKTTYANAETGAEIPENEQQNINREFVLSSGKDAVTVDVSGDDLQALKEGGATKNCIQIENFVDISLIKTLHSRHNVISHAIFLVPSNDKINNSKSALDSLHRSMVRKRRAAIAVLYQNTRRGSPAPRKGILYAFHPFNQGDKKSELQPSTTSGLYFVPLPFVEDCRNLPVIKQKSCMPVIYHEDVDRFNRAFTALLKRFHMPSGFDPQRFPDPKFAQFAYIMEHLALSLPLEVKNEGDLPNPVVVEPADSTRPRYDKINKMCDDVARAISELLILFNRV